MYLTLFLFVGTVPRLQPHLIGMGFANQQLNAQLLEKHSNNINLTEVLNELLDNHHLAFGASN